ncbi:AAA family ATPase [Methanospirillum stamsii]|uniref:AAA family ATPase n=1 Tax=Methanospirillum stamsii TaxID=1277351 RepID=A0A2V2N320_9EURY|nr:AAA family ATPase [Methanospirillum stamsii]PWR69603.1 AAA family ATPase [Methanospirillum stamsii]
MTTTKKRIPIGESDFKNLIEGNNYFVDKSLLIKDIIEDNSLVILLPRPRRFGKTLNMTMLRYFFEISDQDLRGLFTGLDISKYPDIMEYAGNFPVIYLTFKDFKFTGWEDSLSKFRTILAELYSRHDYLFVKSLSKTDKILIEKILTLESDPATLGSALKNLSRLLFSHFHKKPVILIDEYDTPLYAAWEHEYYAEMISFIRILLGSALKDNPYLEKAVLTGVMRIAKESVFSDLNNLEVYSILDRKFSERFGFLEEEVLELLREYQCTESFHEVKEWYNGYQFGPHTVYNPWSVLNYIKHVESGPKPYWVQTSSNTLIQIVFQKSDRQVKEDIQELLSGRPVTKQIRNDFVLPEIFQSQNALFSFLLFSGYLTALKISDTHPPEYELKIPNREVSYVYDEIIVTWIEQFNSLGTFNQMLNDLTKGNIESFIDYFSTIVATSFSYFDLSEKKAENFYHAFVLGLFVSLSDVYNLRSNRESGFGRYDLMLIPRDPDKHTNGFVIEFKAVNERRGETLDMAAGAALQQIHEREYAHELMSHHVHTIFLIGIAFKGKEVKILYDRI